MRRGTVAAGTVPGDEVEQPRQQMPGSDVAAMCGDAKIAHVECVLQHRLNAARLRRPRVRVGDVAAAPDRMRQARVMCRPIELAIGAPSRRGQGRRRKSALAASSRVLVNEIWRVGFMGATHSRRALVRRQHLDESHYCVRRRANACHAAVSESIRRPGTDSASSPPPHTYVRCTRCRMTRSYTTQMARNTNASP